MVSNSARYPPPTPAAAAVDTGRADHSDASMSIEPSGSHRLLRRAGVMQSRMLHAGVVVVHFTNSDITFAPTRRSRISRKAAAPRGIGGSMRTANAHATRASQIGGVNHEATQRHGCHAPVQRDAE